MEFSNFYTDGFEISNSGSGAAEVMSTTYSDGLVLAFRFENGGHFLHGFLRYDSYFSNQDFVSTLPWQAEAEDWEFAYSDSNYNNFFLGCNDLTLKAYFWQPGAYYYDQPINTFRLEYTSDQPQQVLFADFYHNMFQVFICFNGVDHEYWYADLDISNPI